MYAGFCNAKGDYIAVMDADMQDPPSLLPQMTAILESGNMTAWPPGVPAARESRPSEAGLQRGFTGWLTEFQMQILWTGQGISG